MAGKTSSEGTEMSEQRNDDAADDGSVTTGKVSVDRQRGFRALAGILSRHVPVATVAALAVLCIAVVPVAYTVGLHSAAMDKVAQAIADDSEDYTALIKKYNRLVKKYNGLIDEYNDAVDTVDEAKKLKSDITTLEAQRDALKTEVGQAKRTTVSDGVWQVGKDIDAGAYRANDSVTNRCYWEVSAGDDIVQNDMPGGGYPQVTVSDGQQLKLQNCGTFTKQ